MYGGQRITLSTLWLPFLLQYSSSSLVGMGPGCLVGPVDGKLYAQDQFGWLRPGETSAGWDRRVPSGSKV